MATVIDRPAGVDRSGTLFVDVLRWPVDFHQRPHGRTLGRACLWLLDVGELPPETDPTEDWMRLPADESQIQSRVQELADRVFHGRRLDPGSVAVVDGILSYGGVRVTISDTEAAILNRLGETPDQVVLREELHQVAWHDPRGRGALDSRMHTLRHRIKALGLTITTIRGRGFVLTTDTTTSNHRSTSWHTS